MKEIKITLKNKGNLLANASVVIETEFNKVTIKGFQIWRSTFTNGRLQEKINILPPSLMMYGKYIPFIYFEDKEKWYDLEMQIYSQYLQFKKEEVDRSQKKEEEIDINNIQL